MPDIFDQVASPSQAQGGGDIFDQLSAPAAAGVAPAKSSGPEPDYLHPAGITGTAPQLKSPTVDVQPNNTLQALGIANSNSQIQRDKDAHNTPGGRIFDASRDGDDLTSEVPGGSDVASGLGGAIKETGSGLADVFTPTDAERRETYGGAPMTDQEKADATRKSFGGAAKIVGGTGTLGLAAGAPELLETAGVATGIIGGGGTAARLAAQLSMAKVAAGFGIGAGASAGTGAIADKIGASPEAKALVQALAFFTPSLAGLAGIKSYAGETPEGTGVGFSAFGKTDPVTGKPVPGTGIHAVAGVSPEGVAGVGVKVGSGPMRGVRYGNTAPPDPVAVTANEMLSANVDAMQQSDKADAAAQLIVKGASPAEAVAAQQPKPPPTPAQQAAAQMFPNPVIQPQHMAAAAEIIKRLPPEQQGAATLEAHNQLAQQIGQWKTFIGPDGKTYTNNSDKDPAKYASQFINAEVDKHDAALADAQKQQEAAAQPPAQPAKGSSKLQQAAEDQQYARAKTIIEASSDPNKATMQLQRSLGVGYGTARNLIERFLKEKVAANTPTVGSSKEPVVEESRATIDAQMEALKAGTIHTVMLPAGSKYRPALPAGMKVMDVTGTAPGAGRYIYNPAQVRPSTIRDAAKAGTHGDLLGHVQTKEEVAAAPQTVAVVAHKPDGTEIQTSEVTASVPHVKAQVATLHERFPDAQVSVKPIDDVISDRLAAQHEEAQGDIFDQASEEQPVEQNPINIHANNRAALDADSTDAGGGWKTYDTPHGAVIYDPNDMDNAHSFGTTGRQDEQEKAAAAAKKYAVDNPIPAKEGKPNEVAEKGAASTGLAAAPEQPRVEGHDGKKTKVHVDDKKLPATYRLIEADKIQPSHDAISFEKNPKHPGNQRDYGKPDAKARVMDHAQNIEPDYLLNTNPDAVNGPPIIEPDAAVDGGNSRAMSIQRAYKLHPDSAKKYVSSLRDHAASFGFTPEQVDGMKKPMLVREIDSISDPKEREAMVASLNRSKTADLTPGEAAVSNGRKLTPEVMDEISRLIDATGDGASIREMLREHGGDAIKLFEKSGIITEDQRPKYIENGEPSEAGKALIEDAILGNVVDDPQLMDTAPKGILRKLDGALGPIAHIGAHADSYNIIPVIRDALYQHAEVSRRGITIRDFQNQAGLMEQRTENPVVDAIALKLVDKPTEVKRTLKSFALDAKDGRLGQGSLMAPPPTAADAFNHAFGTTLSEQEYTHALARGISEEEPRTAASRAGEGDSGLHEGRPSGSEAEGKGSSDRAGSGQPERKYKYGNTQANLPGDSEAARAVDIIRGKIADSDLAGDGKDIDENHVTVRYGIQSDDTAGIRAFLKSQAPFEARLGATAAFPPSKNSDGAAVIQSPVESPELHRLNAEIAKHGDFKESDFPDYKPHVTIAYVKPEAAQKYVGIKDAEGKSFLVNSISISDRDGNKEEIRLQGKPAAAEPYTPKKDERVRYRLKDGTEKVGRFKAAFGPSAARMAPEGGGKPDVVRSSDILGPHTENAPIASLRAIDKDQDGWSGDSLFAAASKRSPEENLDRAKYTLKTVDGGRRYLHLDHDAYFAFSRVIKQGDDSWSAATYRAEDASQIIAWLKSQTQNDSMGNSLRRMGRAVQASLNEYGHLIVAAPDHGAVDLREENLHSWAIKFDLQDDLVREFSAGSVLGEAKAALVELGYSLDQPDIVVAEATAKAATDDTFLAPDDRRKILERYNELLDKYGVSRQHLPEVLAEAKGVFDGSGDGKLYKETAGSGDAWNPSSFRELSQSSGRQGSSGDHQSGESVQRRGEAAVQSSAGGEGRVGSEYLRDSGISLDALKPLSKLKPVEDIKAYLGDEADRVRVSRDLHNRLYDLASQDNAAILRAVQMLKQMPGTAKDQQAIYHHLEDPTIPLTPQQQEILDDHLTPLIYQAEHDFQVVSEGGVPLDNYVHRQVIERGGAIERLLEKAQGKRASGGGIGGARLSKAAPGAKHRTMMAIEDAKTGERSVVSIKGGRVTLLEKGKQPKDIGPLAERMTTVGRVAEDRAAPFVKQVTELRHEIDFAKSADHAEQLADVQAKIAELQSQHDLLDQVKARVGTSSPGKPDLLGKHGAAPIYSKEATFSQRAAITRKLDALRKTEEAIKAGTQPMLSKNMMKLVRRREALKDAEAARDHFMNELPADSFADGAWKGPDGKLYKITQATTKEIEANTDIRYYQNAAASVAVNYLAMDKARRAYEFLEDFKKSPEFAAGSHSMTSPGAIPKGWKATQLPQLRGYFFEPHIAEVLDTYAKAATHDPGILEKVGNFLRNSIFFNPLIHVPNLLNHWVVEKGVSSVLNPLAYPRATRAGIRAINAVIHQNEDFLDALDHGAPLQSQQFETKQFADLFFKKMHDELGDPESSKTTELAKALGMAPARLVKAIYDFSGKVTWYTNDIAFMQATYEKMEKGMSLKDALRETSKHIPDYRKMTRIFDSSKLGALMSNPSITMFGAYHYGALKSYGQMMKSLTGFNWEDAGTKNAKGEPTNAAGRTAAEEKLHGLDTLAMVGIVTFLIYPLIDRLWKDFTGNDKAQIRRAGASTLIYNLAMLAKGEKTPVEVGESIATPAIPLKTAVELAINRDTRTGQHIYDPHAPSGVLSQQVGRRVLGSIAPVDQGLQVAEGRTDWKKLMYSMVGVSFPLHGAEKIAAQINAERMASLPPSDEATVIHYVTRSRALHDAWDGDGKKLADLLHSDDFTRKEKMKIRKDALLPPLVYEIKGMSYADALRVYDAATDEQKQQLRIPMARKLEALRKSGKAVPEDPDE